ncbi:MAG: BamA/TamA family outer membrane protein [Saprospiraceae bacterium]|nr:BamA/TamA family outer membrane protein [Saprospiraceae bacterium]
MRNIVLFVVPLLLASCMGTRRLPEGQLLYRGAKVELKKADKAWPTDALKTAAQSVVALPVPNKAVLGISFGLWVNTRFKPQTWMHKKFATTPVLFTPDMVETTEKLLDNRALNHGYFDAEVTHIVKIKRKKRQAKVRYTLHLPAPPHRLRHIEYQLPINDEFGRRVANLLPSATLKPGHVYNLDALRTERERLAQHLRNEGYYEFQADYFFFEADTLIGERNIDLNLRVKSSAPTNAFARYMVDTIAVFPNMQGINDTTTQKPPHGEGDCVAFRGRPGGLPPDMLRKTLAFNCGDYYSGAAHETTLAYLFHLSSFKFINLRFEPKPDSTLAASLQLIPHKRHKVKLNGAAVYSPQLYWGGVFGLVYDNRNTFGGAETLRLEASAQPLRISDKRNAGSDINLLTLDAKTTLTIPRLRPPTFRPDGSIRAPLLQNRYALEYQLSRYVLLQASDFGKFGAALHEFDFDGGWVIKNSSRPTLTQEINPLSAGGRFTAIFPKTFRTIFEATVKGDSTSSVNLTYAPQIYFAPNYAFVHDNRFLTSLRRQTYWRVKTTLRGGLFFDSPLAPESQTSPFNLVTFIENDIRQFFNLDKRTTLAGRFVFNAALPLTDASVSSFSINDLYIIGGANSLRAFPPRTIGPGSLPPEAGASGIAIISNHVGNFLMEMSWEYRRRFTPHWEWAAFLDAGNIWTFAPLPNQPGAEFKLNRFYKELAVGTGLGLRYGISFLVIRLDVATPVVKPWLTVGERWRLGKFAPHSRAWRRENLVLNFSVGYPF